MIKQYGIFLNSSQCFILSATDLWITLHTAKLLSSKFPTCVCDISNFDNISLNPESKTLIDLSEITNDTKLFKITKGLKKNTSITEDIISVKDLATYYYHVVTAAWLTDAYLNSSNQNFYLECIDEELFLSFDDLLGFKKGFKKSIDNILYLSLSISEIDYEIQKFFKSECSLRPPMLKAYEKTFYSILNS